MVNSLFHTNSGPSKHAVPNSQSGTVDVVSDYRWTITNPTFEAMNDVPVIELTEYQITSGQLAAAAAYWLKHGISTAADLADTFQATNVGALIRNGTGARPSSPYEGLYRANPTGFRYRIPYFDPYRRSLTNSWSEDSDVSKVADDLKSMLTHNSRYSGGGIGTLMSIAGAAAKSFVGPSVGMERPEVWGDTAKQSYIVEFDLLNTVSLRDTLRNLELVQLLSYQSSHQRHNLMLSYPPCIYEVNVPGVRQSPVAVIESITIIDVGHKRLYREAEVPALYNVTLPDAFRISMSIRELIGESRNIMAGMMSDEPVTAITQRDLTDTFGDTVGNSPFGQAVSTAVGNTVKRFTE